MTDSSRPRLVRSLVFVALAVLGVFAACEVRGPDATAPDEETQGEVLEAVEAPVSDMVVTDLRLSRDTVSGKGMITGTVKNRLTGAPAEAVQVYIPAIKVGALTNNQGRFLIFNVPQGDHELVLEHTDLGKTTVQLLWADAIPTKGLVPVTSESPPEVRDQAGPRTLPTPPATGPDGSPVGVVTGVVRDGATGERVESAQVYFPELSVGALTNPQGRFVILNVRPGTHILRVEKVGMDEAEMEITVEGGSTKEVEINMGGS